MKNQFGKVAFSIGWFYQKKKKKLQDSAVVPKPDIKKVVNFACFAICIFVQFSTCNVSFFNFKKYAPKLLK